VNQFSFEALSPEQKIQFAAGLVRFVHKLSDLVESEVSFDESKQTVFDHGFLHAAATSVQALEDSYHISQLLPAN
jgi:hypothetical protein